MSLFQSDRSRMSSGIGLLLKNVNVLIKEALYS